MRVHVCVDLLTVVFLAAPAFLRAAETNDDHGLQAAFHTARHRAERSAAGYRMENLENRFAAEFDGTGITVAHPGGSFGLHFEKYGWGCHLHTPGAASLRAHGAGIEYQRDGLTEWYRNDARGLEQGFTIRNRPAGAAGELALELRVSGNLRPVAHGRAVLLQGGNRPVLRYTGLRAWDARGRDLPARMEVAGDRVRLLVAETGAVYPITVDPWIEQQEITAPDGAAQDYFGNAVAISGNIAVIGASHKQVSGTPLQGAVYIFMRSGAAWIFQQELLAADGAINDLFGSSVALSGGTLVVGAPGKQNSSQGGSGAAYVFVNINGTWTQQQELTSADGQHSNFGASVAVSNDTAVVGAYLAPQLSSTPNQGAAYVFVQSNGTWIQQQMFTSEGAEDDRFGSAVSISQDTVVVGAFQKTIGSNLSQGAAYVFVRSGPAWIQQQRLTSSDGAANDVFGYSVSISGNTVLVGAWGKDVAGKSSQGAAYVFVRNNNLWTEQQILTPSDGEAMDNFGRSVALALNTAVVTSPFKQVGANSNQGKAYVFARKLGVWTQQQALVPAEGVANDFLGILSVASNGPTTIIGTPYKQIGTNSNQGAAFAFLNTTPGVAGDFDLNGVPDLVWQNQATRQVLVDYYGGAGGSTVTGWSWLYAGNGAAGWQIVAIADFDGDGQPDLVWQNDSTRQVTVHYYGGPGGVVDLGWNWLFPGTGAAGWHVVGAADFNGDGTPDLVWQNDSTRQVTVHYYGGTGGAADLGWNWLYPGTGAAGWHIAAIADFNSDGVPDLVWQNDTTGQVTVHYYGGPGGVTDLGWAWLYSGVVQGWHIAKAADFNGDGVPDLVWENNTTGQTTVHYYGGAGGATDQGWSWLYSGNAAGWLAK